MEQQHRLYAELWTSFAALVRSYAGANDLAKPASSHAVIDANDQQLTLHGERTTLRLKFDAASGSGEWAAFENAGTRPMREGRFEIDEESQVALSGRAGKLELEVAAEIFAAMVFDGE